MSTQNLRKNSQDREVEKWEDERGSKKVRNNMSTQILDRNEEKNRS